MSTVVGDRGDRRGRRLAAVVVPLVVALGAVFYALPTREKAVCALGEQAALETTEHWDSAEGSADGGGPLSLDLLTAIFVHIDYDQIAAAAPERVAPDLVVGRSFAAEVRAAANAGTAPRQPTPQEREAIQDIFIWFQETCW